MTAGPVLRAVLVALSLGTAACVLADKEINFEDVAIANRNAVRLVEATMLSPEAELSCDPDHEVDEPGTCPQPGFDPRDVLPHFLNPAYSRKDDDGRIRYPFVFCSCEEEGKRDSNTLFTTLYVEDQDEERNREPKDKIYAALLLDMPQRDERPYNYVDYRRYVDPSRELELSGTPYQPQKRRDPQLRELVLGISVDGNEDGIDLCNSGSRVLAPGFHSLTVMVTDRPWFRPSDGGIGSEHAGVPDLAVGATFDTITYVFYCGSATQEDDPNDCAELCVSEPEGQ
ncbi:hypothetical protein [Nannocystis sp. SCPEA4]|uniref:hypothetical protein n=1 Tax=Nannocystis sp. SCPEA4 TaxID=2996787 RepID=UPI00226F7AB7|nr:hypothetical protein [Nannocystis sp. SCPEA4]MCY1062319.1 hypothetical protein [Nannocystis sp. SCPEA4]